MLVEPTADDLPENNFNIMGQLYYSFSTIACIPASKSQEIGMGLGAQAGPKKLFEILNNGGFQNVKVADFGLGKLVRPNTVLEKKCGTASYVAPEVLTGGGYSKPADMWSVGVIMHLVLRGKLPFQVLFYFFFF